MLYDSNDVFTSSTLSEAEGLITAASENKELKQLALDCHLAIHSLYEARFFPTAKGDQAHRNDTADTKGVKRSDVQIQPKAASISVRMLE